MRSSFFSPNSSSSYVLACRDASRTIWTQYHYFTWAVRIQQTGWSINNRNVFSQCWRLGSPRRRCEKTQCLVRTSFLIEDHILTTTSYGGRGEGSFWGLCYKDTNLTHDVSARMTQSPPQSPHLLTLLTRSHWWVEFQYVKVWAP